MMIVLHNALYQCNTYVLGAFSAVRKIRAVDNLFMALYARYESCCP